MKTDSHTHNMRMDNLVEIANSLSNQDILHLIPLIQDRIGLWDNEGQRYYDIAVSGNNDRWHSLNGNQVQVEITQGDE